MKYPHAMSDAVSGADWPLCSARLFGIVQHHGSTLQGGHYTAYVNLGPSQKEANWCLGGKAWFCVRRGGVDVNRDAKSIPDICSPESPWPEEC